MVWSFHQHSLPSWFFSSFSPGFCILSPPIRSRCSDFLSAPNRTLPGFHTEFFLFIFTPAPALWTLGEELIAGRILGRLGYFISVLFFVVFVVVPPFTFPPSTWEFPTFFSYFSLIFLWRSARPSAVRPPPLRAGFYYAISLLCIGRNG